MEAATWKTPLVTVATNSGVGWKASPTGLFNPEAKMLRVPSGVNS